MRISSLFKSAIAHSKALYKRSDRFVHLLVGMPSYDKYLEHMRTHHPEKTPKSQKAFFKDALEAKYGAGGAKCC